MSAPLVQHRGWTPPGYYVDSSTTEQLLAGPCAHCGAPALEHQGSARFCPAAPREVAR